MKNKIGNKMLLILVGVHDLDYGLPGLVRVNLIFFPLFILIQYFYFQFDHLTLS